MKKCMRLYRPYVCSAVLLCALIISKVASADTPSIEVVNNLISIKAVNSSLAEIARRLSELTDVPIDYVDENDQTITIDIVEESLETAISKLSQNNLIVTNKINGEEVITEIMIMPPESSGGSVNSNLPTGEPTAEVIVAPDTGAEAPIVNDINNPTSKAPLPEEANPEQNNPEQANPEQINSQ